MPPEAWSTLSGGLLMICLAIAAWIQAKAKQVERDSEAKRKDDADE